MTIDAEKLRALSRGCEYTVKATEAGDIHGEVFASRYAADAERKHFKVPAWVTPLDVPAGAIPGLAATRRKR